MTGAPPWEPAEEPDSDLPWATAPAPSAGNRLTRPGATAQPVTAAGSPWRAAAAPSADEHGSIWDSAATSGSRPDPATGAPASAKPGQQGEPDPASRPIYVWNPAASTDAFPAVRDHD